MFHKKGRQESKENVQSKKETEAAKTIRPPSRTKKAISITDPFRLSLRNTKKKERDRSHSSPVDIKNLEQQVFFLKKKEELLEKLKHVLGFISGFLIPN
jgi:hypothetical protein